MPPFPALTGPSYRAASQMADYERCVGFFLEKNAGPGAVYPWSLLPLPGLTAVATVPEGPGRGVWSMDARCLRASGGKLYEVDAAFAHTERGSIATDSTPAQFASSGDAGAELATASVGSVYIFNLSTNVFAGPIAALTAHHVGYLDGYFLGLDRVTSTLRISELLDGLTWDPTQFAQRSSAPDKWQAMLVNGPYVYLLGSETFDVWQNTGAFPFPLAPIAGAVVPVGIGAVNSAAVVAGAPVWLAQTAAGMRSVVRGNGTGLPSPISSPSVDAALRGYAAIDDFEGSVMEYAGHPFYILSSPAMGVTWLYDVSTDQWTEWPLWNTTSGSEEANAVLHRVTAFGRYLGDDRRSGVLYTVSGSVYSDNGAAIRRVRQVPFPRLTSDGTWIFLSGLEVFLETGLGLQSGQGSDPTVVLQITRDGGRTWGPERTCSAGRVGEYLAKVYWSVGGRFRDGFGGVRLIFTDPVPWRINGAAFQAEAGTH